MKNKFLLLGMGLLVFYGVFCRPAHAWEDGGTFGDQWKSYWKSFGEDLDRAGKGFHDAFLKSNSDT